VYEDDSKRQKREGLMRQAPCLPQKLNDIMQRGPRGRTRGEARSRQSAPQLGLLGRSDACGVASARENSGVDQEGLAPKKSAVGLDCNAGATTAEFLEDVPRSRG
jgi:hypothetical protein